MTKSKFYWVTVHSFGGKYKFYLNASETRSAINEYLKLGWAFEVEPA